MKKLLLTLMLCSLPKLVAQQATLASGGNATGTGGTVSYSIGQVADKTQTGTTGTITQGVQQPFEIVTLSGSEFVNIKLEAVVFPNPTVLNVTLKITNSDFENLNYQLFDLLGKLINEGKVTNEETIIDMERHPTSTFILKVNDGAKQLKTFKIIKN